MTNHEYQILSFWGGGESPVQYFLDQDSHRHYVHYRHGWISVEVDDREVYEQRIGGDDDGVWSDEETNVYLSEISRAIRRDDVGVLNLPTLSEARSHPMFKKGPLPLHPVGLVCGQASSLNAPKMITGNRHEMRRREKLGIHDHTNDCLIYVPAFDVERWIKEHPDEHEAFCKEYPVMWESYLRVQRAAVNGDNCRLWPHKAT
jgi:hypothetical protein